MKHVIDRAKALSKRIVAIQATVLLSVVYLLCMPFLRIGYAIRARRAKGWVPWTLVTDSVEDAQSQ